MKRACIAAFAALAALVLFTSSAFAEDQEAQSARNGPGYILTIADRESRIVARIPLLNGRFEHVFTHSFHLTPVKERFEVVPGLDGKPILHLYELDYESCGVGMPSDAENGFRLVDGIFILDMSRDFTSIPLMVSIVEGHGIVADGLFYPFTDWVPQESMLVLAAVAAF